MGQNLAKTLRKPGQNIAKTWSKHGAKHLGPGKNIYQFQGEYGIVIA